MRANFTFVIAIEGQEEKIFARQQKQQGQQEAVHLQNDSFSFQETWCAKSP